MSKDSSIECTSIHVHVKQKQTAGFNQLLKVQVERECLNADIEDGVHSNRPLKQDLNADKGAYRLVLNGIDKTNELVQARPRLIVVGFLQCQAKEPVPTRSVFL